MCMCVYLCVYVLELIKFILKYKDAIGSKVDKSMQA